MSDDYSEFKCIPKKEASQGVYLAYMNGYLCIPNSSSREGNGNNWDACFNIIKPRINNSDTYYLRELEKNGYVEYNKEVYGIGKKID